jgi:hypothetical protein
MRGRKMSANGTEETLDYSAWAVIGFCTVALGIALGLAFYAASTDPSPMMIQYGLG